VKLGPLLAINDLQSQEFDPMTGMSQFGDSGRSDRARLRINSNKFAAVSVQVNLKVRFGIQQ
jgi:hypothetical protein